MECRACGIDNGKSDKKCWVCGNLLVAAPDAIDKVFQAIGAFTGWSDIAGKMRDGYCPTIYGDTRRKRLAIKIIKARGFAAFGNKGRNW